MPLNQAQQIELQSLLENETFKRAMEEVLRLSADSIAGLAAPEAALVLAQEKGVRSAFRSLRSLASQQQQPQGLQPRSISRRK